MLFLQSVIYYNATVVIDWTRVPINVKPAEESVAKISRTGVLAF